MKLRLASLLLTIALVMLGCASPNKSREDYFGYNNTPKFEKKEKPKQEVKPYVYSYSEYSKSRYSDEARQQNVYIFNNYYPYPYDPRFVEFYDPYSFNVFLQIGNPYYDPFWDYRYVVMPYSRSNCYIVYPYPYWDYYWWRHRPHIIYVPDDGWKEPKTRTVRDFGPSRGNYKFDDQAIPTKESRSSQRGGESSTKSTSKPSETPKKADEPVKLKLPEKTETPRSDSPKTKETPKSDSPTKQERSSTRPR